jgi:hypothetical protein
VKNLVPETERKGCLEDNSAPNLRLETIVINTGYEDVYDFAEAIKMPKEENDMLIEESNGRRRTCKYSMN